MRVTDLTVASTKLYKAHIELMQAWELTKEHWKDENSRAFEDDHLAPLGPMVRMLTDATNRLNEVFARVERDLASPGES
jgi:hypothetical protein